MDDVEYEGEAWMKSWDDVSGAELLAHLVKATGKDELEVIDKMGAWEPRPRCECLARTGKNPIKLRWVDTNKGDSVNHNVRCRLVAKDLKNGGGGHSLSCLLQRPRGRLSGASSRTWHLHSTPNTPRS